MDRPYDDPPARASQPPRHGIAPSAQYTEATSEADRSPSRTAQSTVHDAGGRTDRPAGRTRGSQQDRQASDRGRLGNLQEQVTDLISIRSLEDLQNRVRTHPLGALALAAGIGFALQRTHLLDPLVGGSLSDDEANELTPAEERLLAWLNDAYALEKAQIPILENHADDAASQPHVRAKDLEHLAQTKQHVKMVRRCIRLLGRKPSKAKTAIGRISGAINSFSTEPFDDEVVRNFIADFAAENLEIASYYAIIVAAHDAGHDEIARICEEILDDEEEMVEWLRANLPRAVRDTLSELDILDD